MKNNLYLIRLAAYIVIIVGCLLATDRCVRSLITDLSTLRMADQIGDDGSSLTNRTRDMQLEIDRLTQQLENLQSRTPLTLEALKTMLSDHRLTLRSLSRKTGSGKNTLIDYCDTEFTGSIGAIVRLLHEIDTKHTTRIDRIQIVPADETGDTVMAHLWLQLSES